MQRHSARCASASPLSQADALLDRPIGQAPVIENRSVRAVRDDLVQRFLQHVLPHGFTKVRYYGIYSPSCRRQLEHASQLLPDPTPAPAAALSSATSPADNITDLAASERCSVCRVGRMRVIEIIVRSRRPP